MLREEDGADRRTFIGLRRCVAHVIHALTFVAELSVVAPAAMLAALGFRRPSERWTLRWGLWRRGRRSGVGVVHTATNDRAEEQSGNRYTTKALLAKKQTPHGYGVRGPSSLCRAKAHTGFEPVPPP